MTKRLKTFEQVNEGKRKDDLGREDQVRIDSCGLFYWDSDLTPGRKGEILDWYDSLTPEQKEYVRTLRSEAVEAARSDDAESQEYHDRFE